MKIGEDAGTTPRKPLTPTQRLKLFEAERGVCCVCGLKIVGSFIDEHRRALGLAGEVASPTYAELYAGDWQHPTVSSHG